MSELYISLRKTGLPTYAMPRLVRITHEYSSPDQIKERTLISI